MIFISIGAIPNESNSTNLSSRTCLGAGGILDISEVDNDWNNVTKQGLYVIKGLKCTNMPTEAYNFGALIVFACMDAIVQFYITHNRREFYYRVKYVGASVEWDTWSLLKTAL